MKNMRRLRILYISKNLDNSKGIRYGSNCHGSIEYLSNNLRWFVWDQYPLKSLPENFEPRKLVHLGLFQSELRHLWKGTKYLPSLRSLNLRWCSNLMRTPNFTGMPNLEELNLEDCSSLEEVHHSLKCCRKLIKLDLRFCKRLVRLPDIFGRMNPVLEIQMLASGIRELPSSIFQHQAHLTELNLIHMKGLVALPSSIGILKGLVKLNVSGCSKLESLPEEIGDLENLVMLHALRTLISRPPPSIVRLNKLKHLEFTKEIDRFKDSKENFVFPQLNGGLHSLVILNLNYCNLTDGGLPEDIGCLSSLKKLYLTGNNFEHLPRSIAQLGALRSLDLSRCKRLTQLPEFPEQLEEINADWSNDWICNSLFQNISSLQHDISSSDSLSLRVFSSCGWEKEEIPSWFHHRGTGTSVSVNLLENWCITDNFLGFAVCYCGKLIDITAHLIPLCDDGMSFMTQKLALRNHSVYSPYGIHFFLVPLSGLWDTSKANGKTLNDYGRVTLSFSGEMKRFGFRLLYKDGPELCIGISSSRYDDNEHHEEGCSSSRKQKVTSRIASLFKSVVSNHGRLGEKMKRLKL